jgi:hypothetical protein
MLRSVIPVTKSQFQGRVVLNIIFKAMKTIVFTSLILITLNNIAFTQCDIDQKEQREKYCEGSYLVHSVIYSSSPNAKIALMEGNNYAVYLISQALPVPEFSLTDSRKVNIEISSRHYENVAVFTFAPRISDTYTFSVDFGNRNDTCVLWTIYLQNENHLKSGFYKDFDDLKYNNPSGEFNYRLTAHSRKYNGSELASYNLVISRREAKSIGRILGFSDGKNIYINQRIPLLHPGTEFVKVEFMDRYYYFEDLQQFIIPNGLSTITIPRIEQKIMDMNTGEVIVLSNGNLREIIADNPQLIDEFNNDPKRSRKLKDYLKEYLKNKYQN